MQDRADAVSAEKGRAWRLATTEFVGPRKKWRLNKQNRKAWKSIPASPACFYRASPHSMTTGLPQRRDLVLSLHPDIGTAFPSELLSRLVIKIATAAPIRAR
ncbi:hypothetical protein EYZ11_003378 [Aspergillus tanneri]|uniref:Uncharacterized protein n=1 Tax=Aspergillus tanneri TaxID=1220188 RepID=A0A4S3JNI1_9EURO|nr:hypothetical protein EYZ11_003378 [Aspergillus tanneri]